MAGVSGAFSLACGAEGLAGTRTCPRRAIVVPSREPQGMGPSADPGKEVALGITGKVGWLDINYAPLVNVASRDMPSGDQVSQPRGCIRVKLVVIRAHFFTSVSVSPTRRAKAATLENRLSRDLCRAYQ